MGYKTYYALGEIDGAEIFMAQSEMGTATPGGALLTVRQAIEDLHPAAVIMVGIAFGLRPDYQHMGDILVAQQLMSYEPGKQKGRFIPRGDRVTVSSALLGKFRSGDLDWDGAPVHFGLMLSGEKLVNDPTFRDRLLELEPEAIGGEMEGYGLYVAAGEAKVDWILVKAICDWADGNKDDKSQPLAAQNAAGFVSHVLQQGGWEAFESAGREGNQGESYHANLSGGGAIAQGKGAKAIGQGGINIEGDVHGDVISGNKDTDQ
jgi:nucleoside phosphorylase